MPHLLAGHIHSSKCKIFPLKYRFGMWGSAWPATLAQVHRKDSLSHPGLLELLLRQKYRASLSTPALSGEKVGKMLKIE